MPKKAARQKAKGKTDLIVITARSERVMERGVRIPPPRRYEVYPWGTMKVRDSFTVDIALEVRRRAQVAASAYKARHPPWDYTTRLEPENGVMRIWRTK